ncbi:hypothetical protein Tsubulata_002353 [Turnera subulata]|uniref:GDSL esterase/lipase n=1 Tax=Turnera subulata TaxID=218843 RepID=A0A9Q0G718_9ROSI|nr:hypothetical protein Tsubulata_002353 [Turnera subulata]
MMGNNASSYSMTLVIIFGIFIFRLSCSKAQEVPAMFVLGDSLVDVGNNNFLPASIAKANYPHYGMDFPTRRPTGRFSNGKNAADLLAEKLGLPSPPPFMSLIANKDTSAYTTGVSFASSGAGIFNSSDIKLSIPLTTQIGYYEYVYQNLVGMLGQSGAQDRISKSVFLIVVGNNDIFDYFGSRDLRNQNTPVAFIKVMARTLKVLLKRLHASGARKFVVPGIGAIGCIPLQRSMTPTQECNEDLNALASAYNHVLKTMLQELKSELNDISYSFHDTYAVAQNINQNPATYGFTELKAACCGLGKLRAQSPCLPVSMFCLNRRDHMWWDLIHPTEATDAILVDAMFDGPLQYNCPINVKQLVAV